MGTIAASTSGMMHLRNKKQTHLRLTIRILCLCVRAFTIDASEAQALERNRYIVGIGVPPSDQTFCSEITETIPDCKVERTLVLAKLPNMYK